MDSSNVLQLLEQLDDEMDDLEESLAPLLKTALSESASKLPLLDKAKLYVLVTYAIESTIFGTLHSAAYHSLSTPCLTIASFSILAIEWGQGARTSRVQRAYPSKTVL